MSTLPTGACKHYEICKLAGDYRDGFCILHFPNPQGKNLQTFQQALNNHHMVYARTDFRYFCWPAGSSNPDITGRDFTQVVDFRHAKWAGTLNLGGCRFRQGVHFGGDQVGHIQLMKAVVEGPLRLEAERFEGGLNLQETSLHGPVQINAKSTIDFSGSRAEFQHQVEILGGPIGTLNLHQANLWRGLRVRARFGGGGQGWGALTGLIDLRECEFNPPGLAFADATFGDQSIVDLCGAVIRGNLIVGSLPLLPREIRLDGTKITGNTRIEAELGTQRPRIVAKQVFPRFETGVVFTNVDLIECRLVGNVFDRMEFANVEWPRRWGRRVLYDEVVLRTRGGIPVTNLREGYQILKQKYQQKGDHVRAGDFHYGEMEMKRREYGWPKRILCPEFLYWLLSGYGTGYIRAGLLLAAFVLWCASMYVYLDPVPFTWDWFEALRFSLQAATLQRPAISGLSAISKWIQIAETILGPAQIALLVLALRMRVRR